MNNYLEWLIYIFCIIAVATFSYAIFKGFIITSYSSYQDKILFSFDEKMGSKSMIISPQKLQNISLLVSALLFLFGFAVIGSNIFTKLFVGVIFMIPGILMPQVILDIMLEKRLAKINEQLPIGLEIIANAMRAGMTLPIALERSLESLPQELREEFVVVLHDFKIGYSLSEALDRWAGRIKLADAKLLATTTNLALNKGGSLANIFFSLSDIIRQRITFAKEVKSLTAEGRFQALLMTALPFVLFLILTVINRDTMLEFVANPIGKILLVVMVIMQILAYFWIRKIVSLNL